jgi:asparagine synthetase B (glutamine-hydrolysing)
MAHSLEVRCPLLDHRIVEFAAQLPPDMKLRGFSKKQLLKDSQRGRLPAWLLDARSKGSTRRVAMAAGAAARAMPGQVVLEKHARMVLTVPAAEDWDEHERMQRDTDSNCSD